MLWRFTVAPRRKEMFAALLVGSAVSSEATQAFPWEWWRMVENGAENGGENGGQKWIDWQIWQVHQPSIWQVHLTPTSQGGRKHQPVRESRRICMSMLLFACSMWNGTVRMRSGRLYILCQSVSRLRRTGLHQQPRLHQEQAKSLPSDWRYSCGIQVGCHYAPTVLRLNEVGHEGQSDLLVTFGYYLRRPYVFLSKGLLVRDPLSTIATAGAPILWLLDWTTCHALLDWFGTKGKKGTKTCHPENVKPCLLFIKSTLLGMSRYVPENAQNGSQPRSGNAQSQGRSNSTCNSARPSVITVIIPSLCTIFSYVHLVVHLV